MSLATTKQHLIQILTDEKNKVVALSGKWGTGKSHLWGQVQKDSHDSRLKAALYVSLFGLSSMDQVKLKIVQSAIPNSNEHPDRWENIKKAWGATSKVLESFHKSFSALNEIALLAVPKILKDRVIVLDDIERKHANLNVDEVLGFVDEFTQQHGARVILILNSDQLADPEIWDMFREKVIDQELRLDTSPVEAFDIASGIDGSPYLDHIKKTVEAFGITNIRIICKIIRAVNRILSTEKNLSDDVLARVIPSTVLLSAIYYKGLENGPDFDLVLGIDSDDLEQTTEELDDDGRLRAEWRLKLRTIGIQGCDEYEQLVVDYLKSGLFDVAEVAKIIDRYASEAETMRTHSLLHQFHEHRVWHHKISEVELLAEAQALVQRVHLLDPHNVSGLSEDVAELANGQLVAEAMVDHWIEAFRKKPNAEIGVADAFSFFRRPIHPRIKAELETAKASVQAKLTVFDACRDIARKSGWGQKERAVLGNATAQTFEATINALEVPDLKLFLSQLIDMCMYRSVYEGPFGSALDSFLEACRNICADPNQSRLAYLLKLLFHDAKLEAALNPPADAAGEGTVQGNG